MTTPHSRLRQERLRRGWSLTKVTQLTGINPSNVSLVERGLSVAFPGWQRRIAAAFEMPIEALFRDKAALPAEKEAA
jgi:transcriptional regulator with XRE-family HTH domain